MANNLRVHAAEMFTMRHNLVSSVKPFVWLRFAVFALVVVAVLLSFIE